MTFGLKKKNFHLISCTYQRVHHVTKIMKSHNSPLCIWVFFIIGLNKHVHNKDLMRFSDDIPTHF